MVKTLGIIMIFIAATGFGASYSRALREEYERMLGFCRLARLIRTRIECFNQPLSEIYLDFSDGALDSCGFSEELKKSGFVVALCKCKASLGIRGETLTMLYSFGSELGKSFADEQVKHCDRAVARMSEKAAELEKELPQKAKTAMVLSAAAAVMAAIVLI